MRVRIAIWLVAFLVCSIDLLTKWWALENLRGKDSVPILGDFLSLDLVFNEGAALSILGNFGLGISIITILILAGLVWLHGRVIGFWGILIFGLAIGGAMGNLYDRFNRGVGWGRGPVIDMINYGDFFIGNVADIAIVLAAVATVITSWKGIRLLKPRKAESAKVAKEKSSS